MLMLSFRPLGLLSSIPTAHTFFGTFCWGVRFIYGEKKLKDFLNSYKDSPSILFSSAIFKNGGKLYFTKPACMGLKVRLEDLHEKSTVAYRKHKRLKAVKFVSEEVLRAFLEGNEVDAYRVLQEKEESFYERALVPHASINRLTDTTAGGELFFEEVYATSTLLFLVKVNQWDFEDKPEELLPAIFGLFPLGGGKSKGRGLFEVKLEKPPEWLSNFTNGGSYFYSLSEFVYDSGFDLENSYYEVEVKRPAVENFFGRQELLWKSPLLFIKPGAVMKLKVNKQGYGTLKTFSQSLYHYGYAFPLYLRGEEPC